MSFAWRSKARAKPKARANKASDRKISSDAAFFDFSSLDGQIMILPPDASPAAEQEEAESSSEATDLDQDGHPWGLDTYFETGMGYLEDYWRGVGSRQQAAKPAAAATTAATATTGATATSGCVTPFATISLPRYVTDSRTPDPVKTFAQSRQAAIGADSLASHATGLESIPAGSTTSIASAVESPKQFASVLSGPDSSDVMISKKGRRFAAWFDCSALPRNMSRSDIRLPATPATVGSDMVWSGRVPDGAILKERAATVWSSFPGAKELKDNLPPGETALEILDLGGQVHQTLRPHEDAHASAWRMAFLSFVKPWTDAVAARASQANAVEAGTPALARAKLFREVGGTKRAIARKTLRAKAKKDGGLHNDDKFTFTISRIQTRLEHGVRTVTLSIKPNG